MPKHCLNAMWIAFAFAGCQASEEGGPHPSWNAGKGGESGSAGTIDSGGATGGSAGTAGLGDGGGGAAGVVRGADAAIADASDGEDAIDDGSIDGSSIDGGVAPLPDQSCLEGIADYAAAGPFTFQVTALDSVKVWVPDAPAGCKLPVVHFGNGTGASCSSYTQALEHLASHGFLTACYESTQTGQGTQCIEAVEAVYAAYPDLASTQQVGFTGNGTGGGAAYVCAYRAEVRWGAAKRIASHAMPPDLAGVVGGWRDIYAEIDSPVFLINGSVGGAPTDGLVSEAAVREMYEAFNEEVEIYWYEGVEAPHIPVPFSFLNESAVAWFRWKLLGDAAACGYFKAMPDGERWRLQEQQNAAPCD